MVTGNPHGHLRTLVGGHVLGRRAFSIPANLASPEQGLLVFAPPVAVALWIAGRAWRRLDVWERTGILFSAGLLVFYSAFVLWQTDDAWGPRFLVLVLPFVLLPVLRHGGRAARRWFVGAAILGAAVQVAGVLTVITNATIMRLMDSPHPTRLGWFFRSGDPRGLGPPRPPRSGRLLVVPVAGGPGGGGGARSDGPRRRHGSFHRPPAPGDRLPRSALDASRSPKITASAPKVSVSP